MPPISPHQIDRRAERAGHIPDEVFDAFNELIASGWDGHEAVVDQDEVISRIVMKMLGDPDHRVDRGYILDQKWLDVENSYRAVGWDVKYGKPDWCEGGKSSFTFSKRG